MSVRRKKIGRNRLFPGNHDYHTLALSWLVLLAGIFLLPKLAFLSAITPETVIALTNEERSRHSLPALTASQALAQAAYQKAGDIIRSGSFSHQIDGRKFSDWIKEAGYQYAYAGENLAVDFITAEGVVRAWLESENHRDNLLNSRFSEIGLAVVEGKFQGRNTVLVVQVFGAPLLPNSARSPAADRQGSAPLSRKANVIETIGGTDFAPGLEAEFSQSLYENSLVVAGYLPGFLGQGQKKLLRLASFSGLEALSRRGPAFVFISILLTLSLYFLAACRTQARGRIRTSY